MSIFASPERRLIERDVAFGKRLLSFRQVVDMNVSSAYDPGSLDDAPEMDEQALGELEEDPTNDEERDVLSRLMDIVAHVDFDEAMRVSRAILDS
jgi:hypothetical protein